MARTLEEIRASQPQVDRAKFRATTEAQIRAQAAADGSEAAGPLSEFVKRRPGQRGPAKKATKEAVQLRLPSDTLAAWRASGPGWQTRMGEVLSREAPKASPRA